MKWNRRSSIAFAAAALFTGAGVAVVANAASPASPAGTTSITEPVSTASPTPSIPAMLDDSTAPAVSGADDPATHDLGDDNGVDNPATHDLGDDNGASGHGSDG